MSEKLVNAQIVSRYAKLASSSANDERAFIIWSGHLPVSVSVMTASLKEAVKGGLAPSVRVSHAQDIGRAALMLETVTGADKARVGDVLSLAVRIRKGFDTLPDASAAQQADDFVAHHVASGNDFASLVDVAPKSNKAPKTNAQATEATTLGAVATVALAQINGLIEAMGEALVISHFESQALATLARKCADIVKQSTKVADIAA